MTNLVNTFETVGCVHVKGLVDEATIGIISKYFENRLVRGDWKEAVDRDYGDPTTKLFSYADPLIEVMLEALKPAIEEVCGKELLPTYSYSRIYQPGEALRPHIDRPSCEVSVTINVANKGGISPIYMQYGKNDPSKHMMNPGDAIVYKGCEAWHWRMPMDPDQLNVQFMLHYVDKNGPYTSYANDKRPKIGASSETREGM